MSDTTPARDLDTITADLVTLMQEIEQLRSAEVGTTAVLANGLPGNVASGELIESAWGNATANFIQGENASHVSMNPYVGNWPAGTAFRQLKTRTGHATLQTSSYGDCTVSLPSAFPSGLISVQITPIQVNKDQFWWPVMTAISLSSFSFMACAPQGWPYATGHPPSLANVWTVVGLVTFDYLAYGI